LVNEQGRPEDGFLRLRDIYNLHLPADMVVLSACRTGLGKKVKGEGLIGLTRAFMYAGAKRVVASLWKVDDEATAELMKRFYQHMFKGRMPAASALNRARIEIMQAREQWRAPYYWAGFILQGDW
jgi:CHAT domain-containing protein